MTRRSFWLPGSVLLAALGLLPAATADEKIEKPACELQESPNITPADRKKGSINYVIIHTVEGSYAGCIGWFKKKESKVSAHYVIGFDGKIMQMVKDKDRAWHASVKLYNEEAIGIEHEGFAAKNLWTEKQLRASAALTRWLCHEYGIPIDRKHLLGHNEIAPGRKSDPGPYFDWDLYLQLVKDPKTKVDLTKKRVDPEAPPAKAPEPAEPKAAEPKAPEPKAEPKKED